MAELKTQKDLAEGDFNTAKAAVNLYTTQKTLLDKSLEDAKGTESQSKTAHQGLINGFRNMLKTLGVSQKEAMDIIAFRDVDFTTLAKILPHT